MGKTFTLHFVFKLNDKETCFWSWINENCSFSKFFKRDTIIGLFVSQTDFKTAKGTKSNKQASLYSEILRYVAEWDMYRNEPIIRGELNLCMRKIHFMPRQNLIRNVTKGKQLFSGSK